MEVVAAGVVVFAPRGVGEGVVGVVDLLEFFGARAAFGGAFGDAVGVMAQGLSVVVVSGWMAGVWGRVGRTFCRRRGFVVGRLWSRLRARRLGAWVSGFDCRGG